MHQSWNKIPTPPPGNSNLGTFYAPKSLGSPGQVSIRLPPGEAGCGQDPAVRGATGLGLGLQAVRLELLVPLRVLRPDVPQQHAVEDAFVHRVQLAPLAGGIPTPTVLHSEHTTRTGGGETKT